MWQKVLQSLMCFAVCLPTQLLTNCCCTRAAALVRAMDPTAPASTSPALACCAHTKPQFASEVARTSSCCKSKLPPARDTKPNSAPVEYESQCACAADEHTAVLAKLIDAPVVYATLAARWELPTISFNPSVRFAESDRPPIAHNRRQSQLCVWLN